MPKGRILKSCRNYFPRMTRRAFSSALESFGICLALAAQMPRPQRFLGPAEQVLCAAYQFSYPLPRHCCCASLFGFGQGHARISAYKGCKKKGSQALRVFPAEIWLTVCRPRQSERASMHFSPAAEFGIACFFPDVACFTEMMQRRASRSFFFAKKSKKISLRVCLTSLSCFL